MNTVAVLPDLILHLLQKQNIKRKAIPKLEDPITKKEKSVDDSKDDSKIDSNQ